MSDSVFGTEFDDDFPSVSRPVSRCAMPYLDDNHSNLRRNLRSLLEDCEDSGSSGIWVTDLTKIYEKKFGYPLYPEKHRFVNVMDMVAHFDGTIFYVNQYLREGNYFLQDARKFPRTSGEEDGLRGEIPRSLINDLKKLLKHKEVFTEYLLYEYRKMYGKELKFEQLGFKDLESFLVHVEITCKDIVLRRICDKTLMRLNYAPTDFVDDRPGSCEALPGILNYDPFPKDVCNADFHLEIDPTLAELKEGDVLPITIGEIYTPGKFYITNLDKVELLQDMMSEMNDFYYAREEDYRVLLSVISRGLLCVTQYSQNSLWHRVRVIKRRSNTVEIFFIDYGTIERNVSIENLRYLHKNFAKHPAFCMEARLSGIQPIDGIKYDRSICQQFYNLINICDLDVEVVRVISNCLEIYLRPPTDGEGGGTTVQEILISRCLVAPKESEVPAIDEGSPDTGATDISSSSVIESTTTNTSGWSTAAVHSGEAELIDSEDGLRRTVKTSNCSQLQNGNDADATRDREQTSRQEVERVSRWLRANANDAVPKTKVNPHQEPAEEDGKCDFSSLPDNKNDAVTQLELKMRDLLKTLLEPSPETRTDLSPLLNAYPDPKSEVPVPQNVDHSDAEYASYEASYSSPHSYYTSPEYSAGIYSASQLPVTPSQSYFYPNHCLQAPTLPGFGNAYDIYNPSYYSSSSFANVSPMMYPGYYVPWSLPPTMSSSFCLPPGFYPPPGLHLPPTQPSDISSTASHIGCSSTESVLQDSPANPVNDLYDEVNNNLLQKLKPIAHEKMRSLHEERAMERAEDTEWRNSVPSSSSQIKVNAHEYASSKKGRTDDDKSRPIHTRPAPSRTSEAWNSMRSFVINASMSK